MDGRKIEFITLDDAYEPPKAVQNARRLIQQEEVFALFNTLGTPNNVAIWDYVNKQEVPHVYVATGRLALGRGRGGPPLDDRLAAGLRDRVAGLRRLPREGEAQAPRWPCCTRTTPSARTC